MTQILSIGSYSPPNAAALQDMGVLHHPDFDGVAAMDPASRDTIRAMAFCGHTDVTGDIMDLLPNLGLIANYGVGYDAIDVPAATARGIRVTNTPDVLTDDVADLAVALLLASARDMINASDRVREGRWAQDGAHPLARRVSGGTLGIVGLGRIGRAIADRMAAFNMDIHYTSRSEKETPDWTYHADPVSLAKAVDFLVIALVGGPETAGHVSAEVIHALGPQGYLVNISRGTTVDESALLSALETGAISGAGLDVFVNEPNLDARFLRLDNVVLQPHHASATHDTRNAMGQLQRDNISAFLSNATLLTPVN